MVLLSLSNAGLHARNRHITFGLCRRLRCVAYLLQPLQIDLVQIADLTSYLLPRHGDFRFHAINELFNEVSDEIRLGYRVGTSSTARVIWEGMTSQLSHVVATDKYCNIFPRCPSAGQILKINVPGKQR